MPVVTSDEPGTLTLTTFEITGQLPSGSVNRPGLLSRVDIPSSVNAGWTTLGALSLGAFISIGSPSSVDATHARTQINVGTSVVAPAIGRPRPARDEEEVPTEVATTAEEDLGASSVAAEAVEEITAAQQLATVQNALSLSITQIADILGVSRATVHSWARHEVDIPRGQEKAERLRDLVRVAKSWRERSSETLGRLVVVPADSHGASLLSLLVAADWDTPAIEAVMDTLASRLDARAKERSQNKSTARIVTAENIEFERLRLKGLGQ